MGKCKQTSFQKANLLLKRETEKCLKGQFHNILSHNYFMLGIEGRGTNMQMATFAKKLLCNLTIPNTGAISSYVITILFWLP